MNLTRYFKMGALALGVAAAITLQNTVAEAQNDQKITVAGGCFWCVESDFEGVDGVSEVISGYTDGSSGRFEAVEIYFDQEVITEREIYDLFFRSIDPFDAGGQFCDRGDTYRTAIFISNSAQLDAAQAAKSAAESELGQHIVTQILDASEFNEAQGYHQNYYRSQQRVITRRGIQTQAEAYSFYRNACGRDQRVEAIWGRDAPFIHH